MTCWDILGIEPTNDRDRIRQAYEGQMKFASEEEARDLDRAYREATGEVPATSVQETPQACEPESQGQAVRQEELGAQDAQVVREVVIQVKALLNDSQRQKDVGIWKAILCEPPADHMPIRREIARQLEPQLRPMAENGGFPQPVAHFLGDWFEWFSVRDANPEPDPRNLPEQDMADEYRSSDAEQDQPPQMVNFWPAVIGWIVGLVILASFFGGMGGG